MTTFLKRTCPPHRHDVGGNFLRSEELKEARQIKSDFSSYLSIH